MTSTLLPHVMHDLDPAIAPPTTARAVCDSCPHGSSAHDLTAARYCAATSASHADRGCICRVDPVAVGWRTESAR